MLSKSEYVKAAILLAVVLILAFSAEWWGDLILNVLT